MRLRRSDSRPLSCYAAAQRPRATGLSEGAEREVPANTSLLQTSAMGKSNDAIAARCDDRRRLGFGSGTASDDWLTSSPTRPLDI